MVTDIVFDPLLPTVALALLAAIAALLLAFGIWRGLVGWPFRAGAALMLLVALANPALRREERDSLSDIVLLAVDRSSSQAIAGRPSQVEAALADMQAQLAGLENVEIRLVELADAPPETDAGTLLMTALSEAAAGVARDRIAGAILITDGQVHDLALAPDLPAPAHVLLSGSARDFDRRLAVLDAPAFAIMGEAVTLKLRIEDAGAVPAGLPASTDLVIAVDGGPPQRFTVRVGEDLELPLKLRHGGQNVLQFSVPEVAGELTARNNDAVITINGVRDRLRVLLVSGEPHAGERTWRNLLKSDSSVDLVHFTILRPPGKQDGVPVTELSLIAFPTRELFLDKIDEFDLIIFDRYRRRGILPSAYLDNVARYVENGGAVLVAAGPAFAGAESLYRSPLARVLPGEPTARVYQTGYVPMISETGARHPVTEGLENFAPRPRDADGRPGWGRWLRMIEVAPRSGHTVMTGPEDKPLLILDRIGRGRIALLASDQAWLWHRGYEGGGPQLELLRRLAHWMMKEPELEEEALSATVRGHKITVLRRSLDEGARVAEVEGPGGLVAQLPLREVSPGRYTASFDGPENGLYRLREGGLDTVVALGPAAPKEFENAISNPDILAPFANATRGGVRRIEAGLPDIRLVREGRVAAGRGWIGLTPRGAYVTTGIRLTPLGPVLVFLLLGMALMLTAWLREGR
ncbi:MAG: hypothetical protein KDK00_06235 [Rhodobacteraceae bacterium]|nr:hypothetical protein [Paracoccaceae bacterium]